MTLEENINADIKSAMLAKNDAALRALRAVKTAITLAKTSGSSGILTNDDEVKILQRLVKQRKESIEIYENQSRPELAATEREEIQIIEKYLPEQLSEAEIRSQLKSIIETIGASGPGDTGKVMAVASKTFAGKADNKLVSSIVREFLTT
jgi:uncharacterized protein YqeY